MNCNFCLLCLSAIILGASGNLAFADDVSAEARTGEGEDGSSDIQRVEDGSVISNIHTSKWRVFTDKARDFFLEVCKFSTLFGLLYFYCTGELIPNAFSFLGKISGS